MLKVIETWTVKRKDGRGTRTRCTAQCSCGNISEYDHSNIKSGNSSKCKECAKESRSRMKSRHGLAGKTKESGGKSYYTWLAMKRRCNNKNESRYDRYGGRGIRVCERWNTSFEHFIFDMGEPPTNEHTIDRIDNDGNYEPNNCRWVSKKEQANNKSNNTKITAFGKTMNLCQWAEETGIKRETISMRIKRGWQPEKALSNEKQPKYNVDGELFSSLDDCANKFNMSRSGVNGRFNSESYPTWIKL